MSRIEYEYAYPNGISVSIWRQPNGQVVVYVTDGEYVTLDFADDGYVLNDETAATLATVYAIVFEKERA